MRPLENSLVIPDSIPDGYRTSDTGRFHRTLYKRERLPAPLQGGAEKERFGGGETGGQESQPRPPEASAVRIPEPVDAPPASPKPDDSLDAWRARLALTCPGCGLRSVVAGICSVCGSKKSRCPVTGARRDIELRETVCETREWPRVRYPSPRREARSPRARRRLPGASMRRRTAYGVTRTPRARLRAAQRDSGTTTPRPRLRDPVTDNPGDTHVRASERPDRPDRTAHHR
jgi:hypothetical protein